MSSTEAKPRFTISERTPAQVDYDLFKEDFLNPNMNVKEVMDKHNIRPYEYREYRDRVLEETNLSRKPAHYGRDITIDGESYIYRRYNGYVIYKMVDGVQKYFGRYRDLGTARMVRDKLIDCDWDENVGKELKLHYSVKRLSKNQRIANERFSEFEELYLNSNYTIHKILKKMGISNGVYINLLSMIKEKHGKLYRSTKKQ